MANVDVIGLTAERAAAMLRAGECSSEELAGAYLERIEAFDPALHAYLHVDPEHTLAAARAQDQSGNVGLAGVPIADVPPTAHSLDVAGALREDVAKPGVSREQALANAPDPSVDGFRVPPIGS